MDELSYQSELSAWFQGASKCRLKNDFAKEEACYKKLIEIIEKKHSGEHPDLVPVFERYAKCLRALHRDQEALALESKIATIRSNNSEIFNPLPPGPDKRLPRFLQELPPLPLEFKAVRAEYRDDWWPPLLTGFIFTLLGLHLLSLPFDSLLRSMNLRDAVAIGIVLIAVAVAVFLVIRNWAHHTHVMQVSWCRLSDDGIEYNDHKGKVFIPWTQITEVDVGRERKSAEDGNNTTWETVHVRFGNKKIQLSSRYFGDDPVVLMHRVIRLNCPPAANRLSPSKIGTDPGIRY